MTIQHIEGKVADSFIEVPLAPPIEVSIEEVIGEEGGTPVLKSLLTPFFKRNTSKKAPNSRIYTFDTF